ncbi:MAG TPA: hypothetical protein VGN12_17755 [Pirellulales bacterium]
MALATMAITRMVRAAFVVIALITISALGAGEAFGQVAPAEKTAMPRGEGRLYNLTARPFTVQFHRADGVKWSDGFVIQPGQFYAVRVPKPGEKSEIMGLTGNGEGFVIVRFRDAKLGGFRTLRLTATNPNNMKLEPTWFAVDDSSGIVNLVQQPGVAEAKTVQEGLQKQPALTAEELDRMKRTLRANYVLTD